MDLYYIPFFDGLIGKSNDTVCDISIINPPSYKSKLFFIVTVLRCFMMDCFGRIYIDVGIYMDPYYMPFFDDLFGKSNDTECDIFFINPPAYKSKLFLNCHCFKVFYDGLLVPYLYIFGNLYGPLLYAFL